MKKTNLKKMKTAVATVAIASSVLAQPAMMIQAAPEDTGAKESKDSEADAKKEPVNLQEKEYLNAAKQENTKAEAA